MKKLLLLITGFLLFNIGYSQDLVNIGIVADDGTGDPIRTAYFKINTNFVEVYANVASNDADIASINSTIATLISQGVLNDSLSEIRLYVQTSVNNIESTLNGLASITQLTDSLSYMRVFVLSNISESVQSAIITANTYTANQINNFSDTLPRGIQHAVSDGNYYASKDGVWTQITLDGTTDHTILTNRDVSDQHPLNAITGLIDSLRSKQPAGNYLTVEVDGSITNEIQTLTISNDTIYLSGGGHIVLPASTNFSGDYTDLQNIPTEFTPEAHTHTVSEVIDFDTEVETAIGNNATVTDLLSDQHTHNNKAILDNSTAAYTDEDSTKLSVIETGATADQTEAEIEAMFDGNESIFDGWDKYSLDDFSGDYTDLTSVPTEFTPEDHTHTASEVTNFDTEVSANTDVVANTSSRHSHSNASLLNNITSAYTDSDSTKLAGIEDAATADQTGSEIIDLITAEIGSTWQTAQGSVANADSLDYEPASFYLDRTNHTGTQTATTISDFDTEVSNNASVVANTAKNTYPAADATKLAGIETGATADQTEAEIEAFIDGDETSFSGWDKDESDDFSGLYTDLTSVPMEFTPEDHTHTASEVTNFDTEVSNNSTVTDLVSDQHAHSNKTVLDNTSTSFTTAQQIKLSEIETGATSDQTGSEIVGLIDIYLGSDDWQLGNTGDGSTELTVNELSAINNANNPSATNEFATMADLTYGNGDMLYSDYDTDQNKSVDDADSLGGYAASEYDRDKTNELQLLSYSNDTLYLSNGNYVVITSSSNLIDTTYFLHESDLPTDLSDLNNDVGYLTSEVDGSVTNEIELTPDELSAVQGASSPSAVNVFLTADDVAEMGGGDMLKATYDSDADNIVDNAENLNNQPASYYLNRNTHTGTQTAATISDFDIEVSNNTNVSANTTAKHTHSNSTYINSIDQNVSTTGAPYFSFITNFSGKWYSAGANIWESTRQGYNILFRPRKFGYAETTMELDTNLTTFYTNLKFNYGSSVFKVGNADTLATKAYARSVSNSGGSGLELTSNELAAVNGANSPSVNNVFATINDLPVLGSGDSLTLFSLIDVTIGSYKDTNIVLRFNRELSQHTGIGFAVRIDGVQQYIQSWYLDNANDPYFGILLNMYGQPIYRESKVEISYTKHANTAYRVKDLAGNELENFGWRGVINNSSTSPVSGSGLSESEVRNIVNDSLNAMRSADRVFTGSVDVSGPFSTAWQQLTYSSTLTVDYSTGAPNKHITLTGNPTISISNLPYGSSWLLIYNGASARTISIGTGWGTKWNSLSLDLTSGGYSLVQFVKSPLETHYYVSVNEN